jgi:hypothetical protein
MQKEKRALHYDGELRSLQEYSHVNILDVMPTCQNEFNKKNYILFNKWKEADDVYKAIESLSLLPVPRQTEITKRKFETMNGKACN